MPSKQREEAAQLLEEALRQKPGDSFLKKQRQALAERVFSFEPDLQTISTTLFVVVQIRDPSVYDGTYEALLALEIPSSSSARCAK